MNITLCSAFRNAAGYLRRYFDQVDAFDTLLYHEGHGLDLIWGEGDSTDDTLKTLQAATYRFPAKIVDCTHGGPAYGSIESGARFRQLAHVGNTIWAAIPDVSDAVIYVESDLIWAPGVLLGLLEHLAEYPAVAPMILDSPPKQTFYDVWGFRRLGLRFTKRLPYHPDIVAGEMLKMDSAGSCLALRGELARRVHFPEDCFVGLCRLLHEQGGDLWLDPDLKVWHP